MVKVDTQMGPNKGKSGLTQKRRPKYFSRGDDGNNGGTYFENEGLYPREANEATKMVRGSARCKQKFWWEEWTWSRWRNKDDVGGLHEMNKPKVDYRRHC